MRQKAKTKRQEKRKALIIGVSRYDKLYPLKFCKKDAEGMVTILSAEPLSYKTTNLIGSVISADMKKAITSFFLEEDIKPKDTLLFYFSGHGLMDKHGHYYIAPSDIDATDLIDMRTKGFSFDDLEDVIQETQSRRVIAVLDCCFSGAARLRGRTILKGDGQEAANTTAQAAQVIRKKIRLGTGKCILCACLDFQEAEKAANKEYSIFTYYILQGLEGNDEECIDKYGNVTTNLLGSYVYNKVITHQPKSERPKQTPIIKTESSGDIILAHYPDKIKEKEHSREYKNGYLAGAGKGKEDVDAFNEDIIDELSVDKVPPCPAPLNIEFCKGWKQGYIDQVSRED